MQHERALERRGRALVRLPEDADQDRPAREPRQGVAHPLGSGDRVVLEPALREARRRGDVVVGAERDDEDVGVVRPGVGRHVPVRGVDRGNALPAELDSRLRKLAIGDLDRGGVGTAEEDVELREPERERVVPVDQRDANLAGERVGEAARQLQAGEARAEDHDVSRPVRHGGNHTRRATSGRRRERPRRRPRRRARGRVPRRS